MKLRESRLFIVLMILTLALMLPMNRIDEYAFAVSGNASEQGQEKSQSGKEKPEKERDEKKEDYRNEGSQGNSGNEGNSDSWDKSSLVFDGGSGANCPEIYAEVTNGGSGDMTETVIWELYYAESGNPKTGIIIESGVFGPLDSGQSEKLTVNLQDYGGEAGNYIFKAYQIDGHSGTGILWSEEISFIPCYDGDDDSDDEDGDDDSDDEDGDDDSDDEDGDDDSDNEDGDDDSDDEDGDDDSDDEDGDDDSDDEDGDDDSDDEDGDDDSDDEDGDDDSNDEGGEDGFGDEDGNDSNGENDRDENNSGDRGNEGQDNADEEIIVVDESSIPQGYQELPPIIVEEALVEVPVEIVPQALPQTGEKDRSIFYFIGSVLIGLGYLAGRRESEGHWL